MNLTPAPRRNLTRLAIAFAARGALIARPLVGLTTVARRRLRTTTLSSRLYLG